MFLFYDSKRCSFVGCNLLGFVEGDFSLCTMVNQRQNIMFGEHFKGTCSKHQTRKSKKDGPPKKITGERFLQSSVIGDETTVSFYFVGAAKS